VAGVARQAGVVGAAVVAWVVGAAELAGVAGSRKRFTSIQLCFSLFVPVFLYFLIFHFHLFIFPRSSYRISIFHMPIFPYFKKCSVHEQYAFRQENVS
jgi:hypothetical protein